MNEIVWRSLWIAAVIGLVGCAGSGGRTAPVTAADAQAAEHQEPPQAGAKESDGSTAAPEPLANRLKWSTASEVDNFGFDIYRSISEDGPFDRITRQPIPGAGTVDEPQFYEFVDDTIEPGMDYYYYIESISVDGVRERFSPIIRAPAKSLPGAGASEHRP
jgi:hypothetical protein